MGKLVRFPPLFNVGGQPAVSVPLWWSDDGLIIRAKREKSCRGIATRGDNYSSLADMPNISAPVLLLHGAHDDITPGHHAEALFAAARGTNAS